MASTTGLSVSHRGAIDAAVPSPPAEARLWGHVVTAVGILCRDPIGGIGRAQRRVGEEASGALGLLFGVVADVGLVTGVALLTGGFPPDVFAQLLCFGMAPVA